MNIKQRLRKQVESINRGAGLAEDTGRLCVDALAELERLEEENQTLGTEKAKNEERMHWAETDNDNHWKFRARMSSKLETAIATLKEMRRAAGEDS